MVRIFLTVFLLLVVFFPSPCLANGDDDNVDGFAAAFAPIFSKQRHSYIAQSQSLIINLNCHAIGLPKINVTWYKDGINIDEFLKVRESPVNRTSKWKLVLMNVTPDDNGEYQCVVENDFGRIERNFTVKVVPRILRNIPKIKDGQPGNHTAQVGSSVTLQCGVGYTFDIASPPMIKFMRHVMVNGSYKDPADGRLLVETLQHCSLVGSCNILEESQYNVEDATVYELTDLRLEDTGWYSCLMANEHGYTSSSGYVTVVEELPEDPLAASKRMLMTILVPLVSVASMIFIASSISIIIFWKRWKKTREEVLYAKRAVNAVYQWTKVLQIQKQEDTLAPKVTIQKTRVLSVSTSTTTDEEEGFGYVLPSDPGWEMDRSSIVPSGRFLGEGAFGTVMLAQIEPTASTTNKRILACSGRQVAVKMMIKDDFADSDLIDMVKEMEVMKAIGSHPNIINLLGVISQKPPLMLVLEYAEKGNLKDYLLTRTTTPEEEPIVTLEFMLKVARDVALGMNFLCNKKCVHRDLAARNVLLTKDLQAKVADFGMARDVGSTEYYRKASCGRLPLKWMAPESVFELVSSTKSDVWSFGILLWEIFSMGESPHSAVPIEVFVEDLRKGSRLGLPANCPQVVYVIMRNCWEEDPSRRPGWNELADRLASNELLV